eukprot:scaffold223321_cov32-Tisochrysis_lutea.AAC.4
MRLTNESPLEDIASPLCSASWRVGSDTCAMLLPLEEPGAPATVLLFFNRAVQRLEERFMRFRGIVHLSQFEVRIQSKKCFL